MLYFFPYSCAFRFGYSALDRLGAKKIIYVVFYVVECSNIPVSKYCYSNSKDNKDTTYKINADSSMCTNLCKIPKVEIVSCIT